MGYFTVIPAVYLVLRRDGQVLLLKRANTGYKDGMYSLPAGHVDGGEPAIQAAIREAKEEIALELKPADLRLAHTLHRLVGGSDRSGPHERFDLFFAVSDWQGEPENVEPHKCDGLRWADLDNLPDDVIPEVRQALEMISGGVAYSDFGF